MLYQALTTGEMGRTSHPDCLPAFAGGGNFRERNNPMAPKKTCKKTTKLARHLLAIIVLL
jgi:hypothetical protein